jgi:peptidylprolyl isomerase
MKMSNPVKFTVLMALIIVVVVLARCTSSSIRTDVAAVPEASQEETAAGDMLVIRLKDGDVRVKLRPDLAPKHVERIKTLAGAGEYDNVAFHRVIDGFMAQTGDVQFADTSDGFRPERAGTGGSSFPDLPAEFSNASFVRGTVGMARAADPNSANSQFFIMLEPATHLNGNYTVVGTVESGMDKVDNIKKGDPNQNGVVSNPDKMLSVSIDTKS